MTTDQEIVGFDKDYSRKNDQTVLEIRKQIAKFNSKCGRWGIFSDVAISSIKRILIEKFELEVISEFVHCQKGGDSLEIDIFGYANGTENIAVCVEVKSHARQDSIDQLLEIMEKLPKYIPDHANKKIYGMIACAQINDDTKKQLNKKGIYLATLNDEIFELYKFQNFRPHDFSEN
jgi:RecB family endonuclease NucS